MAEQETVAGNAWSQAWLDAQRKYWDALLELSQQAASTQSAEGKSTENPWAQALERWWQVVAPGNRAGSTQAEVTSKLLDQGKVFFQFSDQLIKAVQEMQSAAKLGEGWRDTLTQSFDQMRKVFASGTPEGGEVSKALWAFWGLPIDTWRRVASSYSGLPGDLLHGLKEEGVAHLHAGVERYLSVPALGYTREWQGQLQHNARLAMDYQKALQDYSNMLGEVGTRTLDRLYQRLVEMAEKGEQVDTLRGLYDLWVDCSEDAYADIVSTSDYAELNAKLINALMAWKHHNQLLMEEVSSAGNLPSKRDLDTAHQRIQALRREVNALREAFDQQRAQAAAPPPTPKVASSTARPRTAAGTGGRTRAAAKPPVTDA